ncbi:undecaprenyl diphosphate synthase family protein [Cupriavidus basilensis]
MRVVGDLSALQPAHPAADRAMPRPAPAGNSGLTVTIAANYGGRWDLLQAMRKMLAALAHARAGG